MKVLGIDTSTLMSTVAVIEDGQVLGEYSLNQDMSHSERLIPMISGILDELKINIKDIDLYAVSTGPGSFTGLRIGAATMKAFSHVNKKPIVGVSTLEALANNVGYGKIVVPIIDARRDRVYTAIYKFEEDIIEEIMAPDVLEVEDLIERLSDLESFVLNGTGVSVYGDRIKEALGDKVSLGKLGDRYPRALSVAELGLFKYRAGYEDDPYNLVPEYLRVSQAEREKRCRE